jgi:hypothetical protein
MDFQGLWFIITEKPSKSKSRFTNTLYLTPYNIFHATLQKHSKAGMGQNRKKKKELFI